MAEGVVIVRKRTASWVSSCGSVSRSITLRRLKRLSSGIDWVGEEVGMVGADDFLNSVENLQQVEDGIYQLVLIPGGTDYETGHMDSWSWRLQPWLPEGDANG